MGHSIDSLLIWKRIIIDSNRSQWSENQKKKNSKSFVYVRDGLQISLKHLQSIWGGSFLSFLYFLSTFYQLLEHSNECNNWRSQKVSYQQPKMESRKNYWQVAILISNIKLWLEERRKKVGRRAGTDIWVTISSFFKWRHEQISN